MSLSNYAENKFLDHMLGVAAWTAPTQWWISLHTADPGEAGTSSEVTGGSYARKQVSGWAAASGGASSNTPDVDFPGMPAVTVTHAALWDAVSGNCLGSGALVSAKAVAVGETFRVAAGDFDITVD